MTGLLQSSLFVKISSFVSKSVFPEHVVISNVVAVETFKVYATSSPSLPDTGQLFPVPTLVPMSEKGNSSTAKSPHPMFPIGSLHETIFS